MASPPFFPWTGSFDSGLILRNKGGEGVMHEPYLDFLCFVRLGKGGKEGWLVEIFLVNAQIKVKMVEGCSLDVGCQGLCL